MKIFNLKSLVVFLIWSLTVVYFLFLNERKEKQIYQLISERDSSRHTSDSMHQWVFSLDVELSRYQRSFEHLEKVNPPAAKEFDRYYSLETE